MGVEENSREDQLPVHRDDIIPPEQSGQSAGMTLNGGSSVSDLRNRSRVSPCMRFSILAMLITVLVISFLSSHPFYSLMFVFLGVLPAGLVAKFIMTRFKDDAVSETFLVNQFLIGAVPLSFAIIFLQVILGAIIALAILSNDIPALTETLENNQFPNTTTPVNTTSTANTTTAGGSEPASARWSLMTVVPLHLVKLRHESVRLKVDGKALQDQIMKIIPLWKVILFLVLNAFLVAGVVEETGKWLVSRRYRKVNAEESNMELGRTIGCSGVLAAFSMGALGFATTENLFYTVGLSATDSNGFPFALIGLTLLRGILAFPVHVGAQFYVGLSAAQYYVFHERNRVLFALLVAISIHGTFDAVALVAGLFISRNWLPQWTMVLVVVFQLFLALLLMLICRGRYKALLERERMVLPPQEGV